MKAVDSPTATSERSNEAHDKAEKVRGGSSLIRRKMRMVLCGIIVILVYMKSGIEKVTKSVRLIGGFWYLLLYALFAISIFICNIGNMYLDRFHIDAVSARYLLSALVQSQAAIVAIVVTLTLIAVQLAASSYSPRVIDIFKKDPIMWMLLYGYGLSIFFGLFVLGMIQDEDPSHTIFSDFYNIFISLESLIYLAYWLGLVAFAALFVYMLKIIDLLKPSNIIKRLSEDITKENVLKFIESEEKRKEYRTKPTEEDPIQPIMDIIHGSVMKYDIATTRVGLEAVTDLVIKIIDSEGQEEISRYFCDHLERVGELAVSKLDEKLTSVIIGNLYTFGVFAAESGFKDAAVQAAYSLKHIGKATAKHGLKNAAKQAAKSLECVGTTAAEYEVVTKQTIQSLGHIGKAAVTKRIKRASNQAVQYLRVVWIFAAKNQLKNATEQTVKSLGDVGKTAERNELEKVVWQASESLGQVGKAAATKRIKRASNQAVQSLRVVGIVAAKNKLKNATEQTVKSLGDVGKTAERNELEKVVWQASESLGQVGKTAAENGLNSAAASAAMDLVFFGRFEIEKGNDYNAKQVTSFLEKIGKIAAEKRLERVTWRVAESLGLLGVAAAEKGKEFENVTNNVLYHLDSIGRSAEVPGHENATKQVAQSFICVGVFAVKNGLDGTAQEAAKSLAELAISNKGPVEQAICESESKLHNYLESFQKFVNLYEQQLE